MTLLTRGATAASGPDPAAPLNVLLITIDDLNAWVKPLGGQPDAATPALARLAEEGTTFTNAHAAAPSCGPSRAAVLTGVAPWRSGICENWSELRESPVLREAVTLPQSFRAAGWFAAGGGKVFHAPNRRPERWNSDPASWDEHMSQEEAGDFFLPAEGREHLAADAVGKLDWHAIEPAEEAPLDDRVVAWAQRKLVGNEMPEPFFLAVGVLKPHAPFFAPQRFFDRLPLEETTLPESREDDRDDIPSIAYGLDPFLNFDYADHVREHGVAPELVRAYLACVSYADDSVGRVLDALDRSGLADRTLVVVVSDHGFHLGEKQHWGKFTLWDESTRSPLFVRGPGVPAGRRVDAAVSLLDLDPTLLDAAGLPPRRGLDGVSLMPLLGEDSPADGWDQPVVSTSGRGHHAVRGNRWRLIRYANGKEELYDQHADPHAFTNLSQSDDPAAVAARQRLRHHLPRNEAPLVR